MKIAYTLKLFTILGKKEAHVEIEANTIEEIKELLRLTDGVSLK